MVIFTVMLKHDAGDLPVACYYGFQPRDVAAARTLAGKVAKRVESMTTDSQREAFQLGDSKPTCITVVERRSPRGVTRGPSWRDCPEARRKKSRTITRIEAEYVQS